MIGSFIYFVRADNIQFSVMCPDKKLDWFNNNEDWREEDRVEVDRIARARWSETYLKHSASASSSNSMTHDASTQNKPSEKVSRWQPFIMYKRFDQCQ